MKKYCFTFGGYRRLDHIDREKSPTIYILKWFEVLEVKSDLSHSIFGIDGIMCIIRDYLPGGALLPTDLFPPRDVDSNEVYQILYSVACCTQCTRDVLDAIDHFGSIDQFGLSPHSLDLSPEQKIHLSFRYKFLGNAEGRRTLYNYLHISSKFLDADIIEGANIYRTVHDFIFRNEYGINSAYIVLEGMKLRVSEGRYLDDKSGRFGTYGLFSVFDTLDAVIIFGRRRDMKRLKKILGKVVYYVRVSETVQRASHLNFAFPGSSLGMEEMILLSIQTYILLQRGEETVHLFRDMWALPSRLLREHCDVREEMDCSEEHRFTLIYRGGTYTVGIRRGESDGKNMGKVRYTCGNGVQYPYFALLFIIANRFLFTYDRDYILEILRVQLLVNISEYFDTPSTLPPIHDLICPPDTLSLPSSAED